MKTAELFPPLKRWSKGYPGGGLGEWIADGFAGGGGTSTGIEKADGLPVEVALNHDQHAIAIHRANHPYTHHFCCDIREADPRNILPHRQLGLLWISPDCTHHSKAKGGKPVTRHRRALAGIGIVWAESRRPRVIILENVEEFQDWGPLIQVRTADGELLWDAEGKPLMVPDKTKKGQSFRRYCNRLRRLGYVVEYRLLVAADYGAPTVRRRLFLVARCDGRPIVWPRPSHAPADKAHLLGLKPYRTAAECIDWSIPGRSIFDREKPLADNTLRRIAFGLTQQKGEPFIVLPGHAGHGFRGQGLDKPLNTITASRDFGALVLPTLVQVGYGERAGQAPRVPGLDKPLGTIVAGGKKHALVIAQLSILRGTGGARSPHLPMPALTSGGKHLAQVKAFLVKYNGTALTAPLEEPLQTITSKPRFGLVTVHGTPYEIVDIHFRMLHVRELMRGQFGIYADDYILFGTQEQQISMVGNSVPPEVAEALVRANFKRDQAPLQEAA